MIRSKASIPLPAVPSALLGDSKATKLVANQHKSVVSARKEPKCITT